MTKHRNVLPGDRVKAGFAWLENNAPEGYVFNFFLLNAENQKPRFVVYKISQVTILSCAFAYDDRFKGFHWNIQERVSKHFSLDRENLLKLGFDWDPFESDEYTEALYVSWKKTLTQKLWSDFNSIGRILAQTTEQSPTKKFGFDKKRPVFAWGAH